MRVITDVMIYMGQIQQCALLLPCAGCGLVGGLSAVCVGTSAAGGRLGRRLSSDHICRRHSSLLFESWRKTCSGCGSLLQPFNLPLAACCLVDPQEHLLRGRHKGGVSAVSVWQHESSRLHETRGVCERGAGVPCGADGTG